MKNNENHIFIDTNCLINKARQEYTEGRTISCKTPQEMQQFFDSL